MLSSIHYFANELALTVLATLALLFVAYLLRLQFQEIRRKRHLAREGLRFGLIQDVKGAGKPLTRAEPVLHSGLTAPGIVSGQGRGARIWTGSALPAAFNNQWN